MTKPRLTDLQSVLLSAALRTKTGSLVPVPASVAAKAAAVSKAMGQLLKRGLVTETESPSAGAEWRIDDDQRFGLVLTEQGRAALGVTADDGGDERPFASLQVASAVPAPTKTGAVIGLLSRKDGATLAELVQTTGWLPHTTRAALTGLRKKGHVLTKGKRGAATCYTIAEANA